MFHFEHSAGGASELDLHFDQLIGLDGLGVAALVTQVGRCTDGEAIALGANFEVDHPIRRNGTGGNPLVLYNILLEHIICVRGLQFRCREAAIGVSCCLHLDELPCGWQPTPKVRAIRQGGDAHCERTAIGHAHHGAGVADAANRPRELDAS